MQEQEGSSKWDGTSRMCLNTSIKLAALASDWPTAKAEAQVFNVEKGAWAVTEGSIPVLHKKIKQVLDKRMIKD